MAESHLEFTRPSHVVGRYALYGRLAAGGMATVHLGRLLETDGSARTVAVKRLHPQFCKDPEFVAMFIDEARLAARIKHPNVVETLDILTMGQELLLVMEYIRGECFSKLLRAARRKNLEPSIGVVGRIAYGLLHGLHAAHEATDDSGEPLNVVHRDISPQNVMIDVHGGVKVLDFGVAKASARIQITRDGQMKGKLSYMSPEQLQGMPVDRRADVFACGVVLWEALTRRRLFVGEDASEVLRKILRDEVPAPSQWEPGLSPEIDSVVRRALCKDPEQRYQTALELALDVERCIDLASEQEVGQWIDSVAGEILSKRERLLEEIEKSTPGEIGPGSDASGLRHSDSDTFERIQSWAEREASKAADDRAPAVAVPEEIEPDEVEHTEQTQTVADARCVDEVPTVPPPSRVAAMSFGTPDQAPSVEVEEPESAVTVAESPGFITMPPALPPGLSGVAAPYATSLRADSAVDHRTPAFAAAASSLASSPPARPRRILSLIAAAALLMGAATLVVVEYQPSALVRTEGTLRPDVAHDTPAPGAPSLDGPRAVEPQPARKAAAAPARDEVADGALAMKSIEVADLPISDSLNDSADPAPTRGVALDLSRAEADNPSAAEAASESAGKRGSTAASKERAPKKAARRAVARRARAALAKPAPKPAAATTATKAPDCRQPYWVDDSGIRRLKLECL